MDEKQKEVDQLTKEDWKICVGCAQRDGTEEECPTCPVETMKTMGIPPDTTWRLDKWYPAFCKSPADFGLLSMTREEVGAAISFLCTNYYPKPEDCPETNCTVYRPACTLGICRIAVGMCGDF